MRAFFILGLFVAAASAASLGLGTGGSTGSVQVVKTGSTYIPPATTVGRSGSGTTTYVSGNGVAGETILHHPSYTSGRSGFVGGAVVQPSTSYVSGGSAGIVGSIGSIQPRSSLQGSSILSTIGSPVQTAGTTFLSLDALDSVPQTVEYNKQVYFFSAPEEERSQGIVNRQLSNILKKNLQVVFIKAPENNAATNAAIQLAKQAIEQRTAIYVLSKENDANQIVGQLQQIQENVQTAPEVAIIRYRTAEDLANAQANIQAQYDNFGGVVPVINGGIVPILNYASPAEAGVVNIIGGAGNLLSGGSGSVGGLYTLNGGSSDSSSNANNILGATNLLVNAVTSSDSLSEGNGASVISAGYLPPVALKK